MDAIEKHLAPGQLHYLSPKARAELCTTGDARFAEPFTVQLDRRSWGAIMWTLRPSDRSSFFLFGKRLPMPLGKPMLELHGTVLLGDERDVRLAANRSPGIGVSYRELRTYLIVTLANVLLAPALFLVKDWLAVIPLVVVAGTIGHYLWTRQDRYEKAVARVETHTFTLEDPLAELVRLDAHHPDPRHGIVPLIRDAIARPDLAGDYVRIAELVVALQADLDRYPLEVIASIGNATSTLAEAPPQSPRDCQRTIDSLQAIVDRLEQLDRSAHQLGQWTPRLAGPPSPDAAIADALRTIDEETQTNSQLIQRRRRRWRLRSRPRR